ncbi:MAG: 50S ribosomal protein L25 [Planctomycetota bacterium]|mgnify:CR=1 FL=1|nr:50S ribosomal protein L25 [Planctomycetota bacterium]MDA1248441.1 50S ribosomal protein L25 [Planctomycetota bacterium]
MAHDTKSLVVEPRLLTGTANSRRLRSTGKVPATLYGLNQDPVSVALAGDDITPVVVSGHKIVDIEVEGTTSIAMIREVQWDTFLTHILHVDLQRVDSDTRVDIELVIVIRGEVNEGVLEIVERSIMVNCPVFLVPDSPVVRVGSLKIDDTVTIADLDFPDKVSVELPDDTVILRVNEVQDIEIEAEDVSSALEPEVIGRESEDEDEDAE